MRREVSSGVGSNNKFKICSIVESGKEARVEAGGRDISSIDIYQDERKWLISRVEKKSLHNKSLGYLCD